MSLRRSARSRQAAILGLLLFPLLAGAGRPDFPPPPHADVSSVGDDMLIKGRRTSVRMFVSDDEVEDVLLFYRDLWAEPVARGGPGFAAEDLALRPWRLLTRVEDGYVMTVQVQPGKGGSWGYLAISRLPEGGVGEAYDTPPSMRGSEVISNVEHSDPGRDATTTVIANGFSVRSNVSFYRDRYSGWRLDMDRPLREGRVHAMRFTRGRRHVTITINGDDAESQVVINEVQNRLF